MLEVFTMSEKLLENIVTSGQDYLQNLVNGFDPLTIQHSDEICKARITDEDMRGQWFWTGDAPLYQVDGKEVILHLGRAEDNLVFRHIDDAVSQISKTGNFIPSLEEANGLMAADTTLKVKLSDLKLRKHDAEFSYFAVSTTKYNNLNPSQRAFAERVYGSGDDFKQYMATLKAAGKDSTRVYVLNPEYVKKNVGDEGVLCRASVLYVFDCDSNFSAGGRLIGSDFRRVRGVRRHEVEAVDDVTQKIEDPVSGAYDLLLSPDNAEKAVSLMTQGRAAGLLRLVSNYMAANN
jgi:hypothetical protein